MRQDECPFCQPQADRLFHSGERTLGLWDGFPVSPGHALLVPKRHVASWFEATQEEQAELFASLEIARREIEKRYRPDGYNAGINIGPAGGQTVPHLHLHLIPRYSGDVPDPRGGVRHVIPAKGNYLIAQPDPGALLADREVAPELGRDLPHAESLITGGDDPLFPHVRSHLDRAHSADLAVAFLLESGLALLSEHFRDLLERRGHLRILTGTYLGVTDPNALLELLDLREEYPDRLAARIFEANGQSFHPKAYLFHEDDGAGVALIGSSNLTRPALTTGVEWNYRTITSSDRAGFSTVRAAFERLWQHPRVREFDAEWIESYRQQRRPEPLRVGVTPEPPLPPPEPHEVQKRALRALEATRAAGNTAGLVVLATGLGKTWLSAFDSQHAAFRRVLFVAHRDEILQQAMATYRRIRPTAHLGLYTGQAKAPDAEVVFASIQTLGRQAHLDRFVPAEFDYLVVDEFHHASARTYRRVLGHFEPKFLLGLTATPERTDGGDLLALCQGNLVFRCDLAEGIEEGLLSPFHYFGVPDEVDYENIPWRSSRFDPEVLEQKLATRSRAQNALDQYRARGGQRTLAFCCSTHHANFMRAFFREAGLRVAAVHSGPESDPRATSLEHLELGELDVVFAVDMFNEGVDVPHIDTVMMLRPTESRILWLQQFGRGLRKAFGKERLHVIDYIGNHRSFLLKPQTLFDLPSGDAHVYEQLTRLERGDADLPAGCEVTYELEAIEILRALLRIPSDNDALRFHYEDFRERYGVRPNASEMHHEGYRIRALRRAYGSWFGFVKSMGDLSTAEQSLVAEGRSAEFLSALETTPMTRSYKMLVLLAMLHADRFPGAIELAELRQGVRRLARRSAALKRDVGPSLESDAALDRKLRDDPIAAWTGGKGTAGVAYFQMEGDTLSTSFEVGPAERGAFVELVQELADWRLAEYLDRPDRDGEAVEVPEGSFVCRVSHAGGKGGKPILFLPPREKHPQIPRGWVPVQADGDVYEANFAKVAVNVLRRSGDRENALPTLLRGWFGQAAGLPGTGHQVRFERAAEAWELKPLPRAEPGVGLELGRSYMRAEIPPAFGLELKRTVWEQGFVFEGGQIFLLVTLDKSGMPQEHRYGDHFLSHERFEWKSQNRHTQRSAAGQAMRDHAERGIPVHLLVRKSGKIGGRAAPFIYCGQVDFQDWEGEKPITVRWRLRQPLSDRLGQLFGAAPEA